jgi:c-di-GMP-binding flagellar brake protein YcgR
METDPTPNRRNYFRLNPGGSVGCAFVAPAAGLVQDAAIIDLSAAGCRIRTSADLPTNGRAGNITFHLGGESWSLACEIVWKRKSLTHYAYGLHFLQLTTAQEDRLMRLLFDMERARLRK